MMLQQPSICQSAGTGITFHPRATWLGLTAGERVVNCSAAGIRVSVLTDSGRIATFLDESIGKWRPTSVALLPRITGTGWGGRKKNPTSRRFVCKC